MNLASYQVASRRTMKQARSFETDIVDYSLGFVGEACEIIAEIDGWKKANRDERVANVQKEIGDLLWYSSALCTVMGEELEDVFHMAPFSDVLSTIGDSVFPLATIAIGLGRTMGTVAERAKKTAFHGKPRDNYAFCKDIANVLAWVHVLVWYLKLDMGAIMQDNVKKLLERYPEGFVTGGGHR